MPNETIEPRLDAIQASLRMVQERATTASVEIVSQIPASVPVLNGDERLFRQILLNLLSNAVKFTPAGGKVAVHAEIDENGCFVLTVSDTGIGISADDIPKVFTPFNQVDSSLSRDQGGSGLGLPLVKSLIEMHGGTIELESDLGDGTIATIRFPAERVLDDPAKIMGDGIEASAAE